MYLDDETVTLNYYDILNFLLKYLRKIFSLGERMFQIDKNRVQIPWGVKMLPFSMIFYWSQGGRAGGCSKIT